MIKLEDLHQFPDYPGRYMVNHAKLDMLKFREALEKVFMEHNIPAQIGVDCVVSRSFFNTTQDSCYVISHREMTYGYFKICVRFVQRGSTAYILADHFGESIQTNKQIRKEYWGQSGSVLKQIASSFAKPDEFALDEEYAFYYAVLMSIEETINRGW